MLDEDEVWILRALELAGHAERQGEVPIGAVLVLNNQIIGEGYNRSIMTHDPTAHAEIAALREAGQVLGNYRLVGTTLYTSLEPCVMCMGAIVNARVARLVFGAYDAQRGAAGSVLNLAEAEFLNHRVAVRGGVLAADAQRQLKAFFHQRR